MPRMVWCFFSNGMGNGQASVGLLALARSVYRPIDATLPT
jgi:hypothetical protein